MEHSKNKCSYVLDTKSGRQCKKSPKIRVEKGAHAFCWVHWGIWYREKYDLKVAPEPWTLLGMQVDAASSTALKTIRKMLRIFPGSVADGAEEGSVYCFQLHKDCDDPLYHKIGYVGKRERLSDRLDNEWRDCELVEKWNTHFPAYAESLIHALLNTNRVQRWVQYAAKQAPGHQKRYISTWYGTDEVVQDSLVTSNKCLTWLPDHLHSLKHAHADISIKTKASERYRMEDEWFYCEYDTLKHVIESVIHLLKTHKTSEEWFKAFE